MTEQATGRGTDGPHAAHAEALRLLGAVQDWAGRTFPEASAEHANGTCQWCPICQFVAVLRGDRPEITDRVAEAGSALVSAFRAFVDATVQPGRADERPSAGREPSEPAAPRVQRIDLSQPESPRPRPGPFPGA